MLFFTIFSEVLIRLSTYSTNQTLEFNYNILSTKFYNISIIPKYFLYCIAYYYALNSTKARKIVLFLYIIFFSISISNFIFWKTANEFKMITHIFASLLVIILVFFYFEQVRKKSAGNMFLKDPMIWISIGIFFFHLLTIPYLLTLSFLIQNNIALALGFYYFFVGIASFMYILFFVAYLCPTPKQK